MGHFRGQNTGRDIPGGVIDGCDVDQNLADSSNVLNASAGQTDATVESRLVVVKAQQSH